jgi:RNA recognition motif-containing protein
VANFDYDTKLEDLEKHFGEIGRCKVNLRGDNNYCFVDYDDEKDAERAIRKLNDVELDRRRLRVAWSKRSKNYTGNDKDNGRGGDRGRDRDAGDGQGNFGKRTSLKCYNC